MMSKLEDVVVEWLGKNCKEGGMLEDAEHLFERLEIVDPQGLLGVGERLTGGTFAMMEVNGIERGAVLNNVLMMLLGAHLGRKGLL